MTKRHNNIIHNGERARRCQQNPKGNLLGVVLRGMQPKKVSLPVPSEPVERKGNDIVLKASGLTHVGRERAPHDEPSPKR
jgi:hypothetical protein